MAKRSGIQLAYPFSEKRLLKWSPPWLIQPKLDGERCRMIVSDGRCLLLSSSEEIIPSVPHINAAGISQLPNGEYDGELYRHGWNQSKIHSVVSRTKSMHPEYEKIQFHIFDIVKEGNQAERVFDLLRGLPELSSPLFKVQSILVETKEQLYTFYDHYIKQGYEGFILRHLGAPYVTKRSLYMMKFKPKQTDEYSIIGVNEAVSESGHLLEMVGAFVCVDDMRTEFKVGAGKLTHPERRLLWSMHLDGEVIGKVLEVEYQTKSTKNRVPLFSRAVRLI